MEFWKSPKNRNFLKGLDHGFCEKIELFIIFVFWANQATKNHCFEILRKKECFSGQKKEVFKKSNQWKSFKGVSPWFWSKNRTFLCVFLGQIKQCFLDLKK